MCGERGGGARVSRVSARVERSDAQSAWVSARMRWLSARVRWLSARVRWLSARVAQPTETRPHRPWYTIEAMRITRLEMKNVGPFGGAVFEIPSASGPGEVVLFEGPNGCGKTTIAEAIATFVFMADFPSPPWQSKEGSLIRRWSTSETIAIRSLGVAVTERTARRARENHCAAVLEFEDGEGRSRTHLHRDSETLLLPQEGEPWRLVPMGVSQASQTSAAFAYRSHHPTPSMKVAGPKSLDDDPLRGALTFEPDQCASEYFAQFLTNLEYERVRATTYAHEQPSEEFTLAAASARDAIERIERVLSRVLDRRVEIRFPFRQTSPQILFDGDEVPIELLGEGMRSTVSWLADLLVRLERISWQDRARSPLDQDFWLILDEIDEGLHPRLQMRLFPALRELFPRARIYATTHSPFVVASLGDGVVFPIRPDAKTHRVSGVVAPKLLRHGQSLALVVEDIFDTPSDFIDDDTRSALARHRESVDLLRRGEAIDWAAFRRDRAFLLGLNDEVATVVAMREVPARKRIEAGLTDHDEAAE